MEQDEEQGVARDGWHILRDGAAVTVTRAMPVRWDVSAVCRLPEARRLRLAQQVRQDLWRRLRRQKGFQPAVEVCRAGAGLRLRAGGRVSGRHDRAHLEARIAEMLADPALRRRWLAHAARHPNGGSAR